jgi:hypothetical protein
MSELRLVTPSSLLAGLAQIRRRRRLQWIMFWTYIPGAGLLLWFFGWQLFPWIPIIWLGAFLVTGLQASLSRCPRCGQHFAHTLTWHNAFTQECLHCGLRLRATEAELRAELEAGEHGNSGAA